MSRPQPEARAVLAARRSLLPAFEARVAANEPRSLAAALAVADALVEEALALGVWPPADRLAGIDVDVRVAEALRRVR